jgi:CheY-like chemotaxis protein
MKRSTIASFLDIYRGRSTTLAVILAVGHDPLLSETRSSILRAAGYLVESASSIGQAIDLFRDGDFDLVVLCHSIPAQERDLFLRLIRAYGSSVPIVCIAPISDRHPETSADFIIEGRPMGLLCGVETALNKAVRQHDAREAGVPASRAGRRHMA